MKRATALSVLITGICASHAHAQTSELLLSSLSVRLVDLNCAIAGPTVERLQQAELLRSLEQGIEAIRSRQDADDDAPPSLRAVGGRPRIEGGREGLQRGALLIDNIWDGLGPRDTTDDVLRDARRFLDAGIIDDDDDDSIAVVERAVLTQAFAYAVNSRIAGLCGTTLGGTGNATAGDVRTGAGQSASTATEERALAGGVQTLGGAGGQARVRLPAPAGAFEAPRRRSWGRTWAGSGLAGGGFLIWANGYSIQDSARLDCDYGYYQACDSSDGLLLSYVGIGTGVLGVLLMTTWSDVPAADSLAVSVTPDGGVLASKSFGW